MSYQQDLGFAKPQTNNGPVECLGKTFESDDARRAHFLGLLREKLRDPEFRKTPGFPKGSDEAILRLSDPPYYTACPNPFLGEFIRVNGKPYDPNEPYEREPFAVDSSVGKTDQLYKAHGYHTKVPHLAIVPSILHYTRPGDVVLDGFCGSGMTGLAAQWCGTAPASYRQQVEAEWKAAGHAKPEWGARRVTLNDLGPAASFIAAGYNLPFDVERFEREAQRVLSEVEHELGWMYECLHVEPASSRLLTAARFGQPRSRPSASADAADGITDFTLRSDNLPHWQSPGATYFLTFKTHQRRPLSDASRQAALNACLHWRDIRWHIDAVVVMSDHVHLIAQPMEKSAGVWWDLATILHSVKSFSANEINRIEGTPGEAVWQSETYDRIIRDEHEFATRLAYLANNPVKAGWVAQANEYRWLWVADELVAAGWKPAPLGRINYTVWSEVFSCPECAGEVVFTEEALDPETKRVHDEFPCPHCGIELTRKRLDRFYVTHRDQAIRQNRKVPKRWPVIINYDVGTATYERPATAADIEILGKIEKMPLPSEVPTAQLPYMHMTHERARMDAAGVMHVHHFFLPRAAHALAALWRRAQAISDVGARRMVVWFVEQAVWGMSVLNRYKTIMHGKTSSSNVNQYLSGVYYVPSQHSEVSPWYNLTNRLGRLKKVFASSNAMADAAMIQTGDCATLGLPDRAIDYIFTDPPFGENIYYADLNFLVEAWHGVLTASETEAIVDQAKKKGVHEYQELMRRCFAEYHRVLKPGRWMTVVFSNSSNGIWRAIQEAMGTAGFVVADVRTLDKKQGSYRQVTSSAVKQDLVISAYKPTEALTHRFELGHATAEGAWAFVKEHLGNLPVFVGRASEGEVVAERTAQMLLDRMIAFHVQRGISVPLSGPEFLQGLAQRFPERDGMYFLPDQVAEYDRKRTSVSELRQLSLFVSDEASAIQWVRQQLQDKPQSFQDLTPQYMREIQAWAKHEETVELKTILEESFLHYDGRGPVPSQIHRYLSTNYKDLRNLDKEDPRLVEKARDRWYVPDPSKQAEREAIRGKALLREFAEYKTSTQRKLKVFRAEAVRAGFKACWQERDYGTIVKVAEKLPDAVLQEDEKLLMYYDNALTRMGGEL